MSFYAYDSHGDWVRGFLKIIILLGGTGTMVNLVHENNTFYNSIYSKKEMMWRGFGLAVATPQVLHSGCCAWWL
jgi:hypothetical protein